MKLRWFALFLAIVCAAALLWLARPHPSSEAIAQAPAAAESARGAAATTAQTSGGGPGAGKNSPPSGRIRKAEAAPDGRIVLPEVAEIARTLHKPESPPIADIEILQNLMSNYQSIMGTLPFGLNHEITEQLCGQNPKRYAVLPPDFTAFNEAGEIVDRWGTPYFFHALNNTRLEIRSAGADKLLWSPDDVGEVTSP